MIIERIPEIGALSEDEKVTLVHQLLRELADAGDHGTEPDLAALVEKRLQNDEANPDEVLTWDKLKTRILESTIR